MHSKERKLSFYLNIPSNSKQIKKSIGQGVNCETYWTYFRDSRTMEHRTADISSVACKSYSFMRQNYTFSFYQLFIFKLKHFEGCQFMSRHWPIVRLFSPSLLACFVDVGLDILCFVTKRDISAKIDAFQFQGEGKMRCCEFMNQ